MSKVACVIGLGGQGDTAQPVKVTGATRTIEEYLRAEYEAAQAEFDRARENSAREPDINICRRYIQATEKLRKFLAYGQVPCDVVEKLKDEESDR